MRGLMRLAFIGFLAFVGTPMALASSHDARVPAVEHRDFSLPLILVLIRI